VETVVAVLAVIVLFAVCLLGLFSLLLGLPGTFVIVGAAVLYGWMTGFAAVTWATVGWLLFLAVIGEGLEFAAGALGVAGARPSRRVTVGALLGGFLGGIVGTPFFLGLGALIGALVGAFAGAAVAVASEGGDARAALGTGLAAFRGRLLGFVVKAAIAVGMVMVLILAIL
jgi:uncharacterized protein YqgC (DUF456 family)